MLLAGILGGAITDRVERRRLLLVGQTLIVCNEIFIISLLLTDNLEFWHMLCTAFVAGCAFPFIMPARMAITVNVVGPQRIQSAMALQASAMNLSRVAGPAMMGIIIAQFSVTGAYVLSIILYSIAIFCTFGVHPNRAPQTDGPKKPLMTDIIYGFSYLGTHRPVLICLLFGLLPMFLAMPFQNILVVLAEQAWQVGESGVGTLMATAGIGGVLGSIWIVRRGDKPQRMNLMLGSTAAFGVCLAVFTQTNSFYLALIPLLVANICASACQTVNNATVQLLVDDSVRGRMSSFMMMSFGLTPLGVFPMAIAADRIGAANAILGACIILIFAVAAFYLFSPVLRRLDSTVSSAMAKTVSA